MKAVYFDEQDKGLVHAERKESLWCPFGTNRVCGHFCALFDTVMVKVGKVATCATATEPIGVIVEKKKEEHA